MSLPTFIIPGAPKCGTTALWSYLNEHPQVCMAGHKEPHFFTKLQGELSIGVERPGPKRFVTFNKGLEWYEGLFKACGNALARGEASTQYFSAPDSPALIKAYLADPRLIFLLRDPVARLYSHYWYDSRLGWNFPDFEASLQENHPIFQYYSCVSSYRMHLENYFSLFSMDHVLILLDTDLRDEPTESFRTVCGFIGVNPDFRPTSLGKRFNPQKQPRFRSIERLITELRYSRVSELMPDRLRNFFGVLRRSLGKITMTNLNYPPMASALRVELVKQFEADIAYLERLLARDLSSWRSV